MDRQDIHLSSGNGASTEPCRASQRGHEGRGDTTTLSGAPFESSAPPSLTYACVPSEGMSRASRTGGPLSLARPANLSSRPVVTGHLPVKLGRGAYRPGRSFREWATDSLGVLGILILAVAVPFLLYTCEMSR